MMSVTKNFVKTYPLFILLMATSLLLLPSCANSDNNTQKTSNNSDESAVQNLPATPSQASGVFHYTCPNGHQHGADNAGGTCPECGAAFVHNDAYHANLNTNAPMQQPDISAPNIQMGGAKNGVFHYICPNGHEGGGDNAGSTCAVCGASLVHNQAYHN